MTPKPDLIELGQAVSSLPSTRNLLSRQRLTAHESFPQERRQKELDSLIPGLLLEGQNAYKIDHKIRDSEYCNVCQDEFMPGHVTVRNPSLQEQIDVPYAALHNMEHHGTMEYTIDGVQGDDIDTGLLVLILNSKP